MIGAARKILIGLMGGTVLLIGIIMIVTPGPALIVIPAGLAILATEFAWARHYKDKIERKIASLRNRHKKGS
jgi:tellurite resistance protein TerC